MGWGGSRHSSRPRTGQVLVVLRVHRDARSVSSSTSSSWFSLVGVRRLRRFLGRGLVLPEGPGRALGSMRFNLVGREAPSTNRARGRLVARALAARGLHVFSVEWLLRRRRTACASASRDGVRPARAQRKVGGGWGGGGGAAHMSGIWARKRRGARRGARDADIRLASRLPELENAARGAAILRSQCAPNVWAWYRHCPTGYPRPRALRFAGLFSPISAACPDPALEPRTGRTVRVPARARPRRPLGGGAAALQHFGAAESELQFCPGRLPASFFRAVRPPRTARRMP